MGARTGGYERVRVDQAAVNAGQQADGSGEPAIFVDLDALVSTLPNPKAYRPLATLEERYRGAVSAQLDLETAWRCVAVLHEEEPPGERVGPVKQDEFDGFFKSVFLQQAVLFYTRATHTQSAGRRGNSLTNSLQGPYIGVHKTAVDLRNKVIAHFEPKGTHLAKGWVDERSIARVDQSSASVFLVHGRTNYKGGFVTSFAKLVFVMLERSKKLVEERRGELAAEVARLITDDGNFRKRCERHQFDAEQYFNDPGLARRWRDSWGTGESVFAGETLIFLPEDTG